MTVYKNLSHQLNTVLLEHMDRIKVKDRSYFDIVFQKNTDLADHAQTSQKSSINSHAFLQKLGAQNLATFMKVNKVLILHPEDRAWDFYKYNFMTKFKFKVFVSKDEFGVAHTFDFEGKIWYMKDKQKCLRCLRRSVDVIGEICGECEGKVDVGLFDKYKDWLLLMR